MNSSNFPNVLQYLLLSHLEKHLPVHQNHFAYLPATGYNCLKKMQKNKTTWNFVWRRKK